MPKKVYDPCKKSACQIQSCLQENGYQEDKCQEVLEAMRKCCVQWKGNSLCCEGIDINKTYKVTKKEE